MAKGQEKEWRSRCTTSGTSHHWIPVKRKGFWGEKTITRRGPSGKEERVSCVGCGSVSWRPEQKKGFLARLFSFGRA